MSTKTTPIILCGLRESVGKPVIEGLQPHYEVVHFIATVADGIQNIPRLLSNQAPIDPASHIGTANYTATPVAVVFGGGYSPESIEQIRAAHRAIPTARKVPYLCADLKKTEEMAHTPGTPVYPLQVAGRVRDCLDRLEEGGRLDGSDDGIYFW